MLLSHVLTQGYSYFRAYNPNPTKTGESFDMNHPIE